MMFLKKGVFVSGVVLTVFGAAVAAKQVSQAKNFDLKDPKGVSGVSVSIDALYEPIFAQAGDVSGSVEFVPTNPTQSKGTIVIAANSLKTTSDAMTAAMHQDWCLDVAKFPTMQFKVTGISSVKRAGEGTYTGTVTGDFTLRGVTKSISAPVTATYLAKQAMKRGGTKDPNQDLMVIRANFSIDRKDFNVAQNLDPKVIGQKVDIKVAVVGYAK